MNNKQTYLFLLLLCFLTNHSVAQNSQLRPYTIEDGLPQSQVYDIVQDDMGYLWLGTQGGGLANFDGASFTVWNESDGLLSNYILALYAQNDSLFVGSKNGLSIKAKGQISTIDGPQIHQFYRADAILYVATQKGVYRYSKAAGLEQLDINPDINNSAINNIYFDGTFFWLATYNGLWKLSDLTSTADSSKLETNNFTSLVFYGDVIFAATFDDGIRVIDVADQDNIILIREPRRINSMAIQNKNELWVATDNEGITVIDTESYEERNIINTQNGLRVPHVRKSISDANGTIWIATSGGGFYKYFQNNFKHYDRQSGLKGDRTYAVHQAKKDIWISSSEAGLTRIDSLGVHHIAQIPEFANAKIKTLASDAKGNIWAGSDGMGLLLRETKKKDSMVTMVLDSVTVQLDTLSKTVIKNHVINTDNGFPDNWIRKIIVTRDHIWAATYASGIVKYNYYPEADSLVIRKTFGKRDGISDLLLKDMVQDNQGRIWYATKNGNLGYIENDKVTNLPEVLGRSTSIGTLLFQKDKLFIGTAGQGIWYAKVSDSLAFQKVKGAKKLTSQNIYQLIFDDQGYLWAGTERGMDKLELSDAGEILDRYHFGRNDGFLAIETCANAVATDAEGNLWFGGIYGLTKYTPSENTTAIQKPEIRFTQMELDYQVAHSIVAQEWAKTGKVLQLSPDRKQLAFSYKTVDINHPNDVQYRTRLNDTEWGPWTTENRQNLVGLAYGAHQFSVQSRNYRWQESDVVHFNFFLDSPWYKKPWFQWALLAFAVILVALTALVYIKRIKARNRQEQEKLQLQNHLLTLEQKALRLQMNPHFIFNVLNGIKAMGNDQPQKMNTTINSFAVLLRETLNNSRADSINLSQEIKTLTHYIEVEKLMSPKPFTSEIIVDTTPDAEEILIPPMLIQPFVENAIRHGILKGPREGELIIRFYTEKELLTCTITDNGMGIFESQKAKTKTDHQSMALTVTQERLESISGKDALEIKELKDADNSISGTRIILRIPLQTDY
ncbi:two-component regulator propeller domain-containing protein [Maribacter chungangensis]|uniref:Two-component regulator propeller domain-containing protein n=1 Tax=Maribacter chungangensis TaxID=1069117 RepID=A0ABW3B804_9FLAO